MKILKLLGLTSTLALATIPFVLNNKRNNIQYNTTSIGFDKLQKHSETTDL